MQSSKEYGIVAAVLISVGLFTLLTGILARLWSGAPFLSYGLFLGGAYLAAISDRHYKLEKKRRLGDEVPSTESRQLPPGAVQ